MFRITAPAKGHTGTVAGVHFSDGVAEVETLAAHVKAYFHRHGHVVEELGKHAEPEMPAEPETPVEPAPASSRARKS